MAIVHDAPIVSPSQSRLASVLTTDFCPWANRFVYWLKEPIGWFVLATAISVMIGLYFNPVGWTLAASLVAIMAVGMVWPLVAVRMSVCHLQPEVAAVYEDSPCRMIFSVRNRLPIPIWGLSVEGYLDVDEEDSLSASLPTVALSCIPPICVADYAVTVHPRLRGHYPIHAPQVACSFPFGIWTARRELKSMKPLTVWPKVFPIDGICPLTGRANADHGDGQRGGRSGDMVGVRVFRRGDSPRHIHWIGSARTETLIVTERGGPQCVEVDLWVDTSAASSELAWQIRVAASLMIHLQSASTPMRISLGDRPLPFAMGAKGRHQILDALADVPHQGTGKSSQSKRAAIDHKKVRIEIGGTNDGGGVEVKIIHPTGGKRAGGQTRQAFIDCRWSPDQQMANFWREVCNDTFAA